MITIENKLLPLPFADRIMHIYVGSQESAELLGFSEGGHWSRIGNLWQLDQPLRQSQPFDENKCHECQGWGAPTGCRTCGLTCMGG